MFINQAIAKEIYESAGEARKDRARSYVKEKRVMIENYYYEGMNDFSVRALVEGKQDKYHIHISVRDGEIEELSCQCEDYHNHYAACKHIVATILEIDGNPRYVGKEGKRKKEKYPEFKELIQTFYQEDLDLEYDNQQIHPRIDTEIEIIPKLIYDSYKKIIKLECKIGTPKQYYILRDLVSFYERMVTGEVYQYGVKLTCKHEMASFCKEAKPLIIFLMKYAEMMKYVNHSQTYHHLPSFMNPSHVVLTATAFDELFVILKGQTILWEQDYETQLIKLLDYAPDIHFTMEKGEEDEYQLICNISPQSCKKVVAGEKNTYVLLDQAIYRCNQKENQSLLRLLEVFQKNYTQEIRCHKKQMATFFSMVLPRIEPYLVLEEMMPKELEIYIPKPLEITVWLELDLAGNIVAKLSFRYGEVQFNPLIENPNIARKVKQEVDCLNQFRKNAFLLDRKQGVLRLTDEERIYEFLSKDLETYVTQFEVLASEDFKQKQIRKPNIGTLGVKIENNLLSLHMDSFNFDKAELKKILEEYTLKKKYHRLKDGTFLSLEENEEIEFLNQLLLGSEITQAELEKKDTFFLPMYRSLYMQKILEKLNHVPIQKNDTYQQVISQMEKKNTVQDIKIPDIEHATLREYQKIGFQWLKTLDQYHLGGILADDMGLGKTLQIITLMLEEKRIGFSKPMLVVCPSSLSLNWKKEIEKFAPSLRTQVISGTKDTRKQQIEAIPRYDVTITSYDLLKRDVEEYKNQDEFRYIIADEAQYIKNSNTQNAKAIKNLKAQTRYALTGTPIENSLSELWSIFDFLMPGYLHRYSKFRQYFELPILRDQDEKRMGQLKQMIEPFLLRRTKQEVLTELPEKTVSVLYNEMESEQKQVYEAYLAKAREEWKEEVQMNAAEQSHIKMLALLTRLRQICCHPSLFLENYKGTSSKLNQCIEIIKEGIQSGHKILLFSVYTSMFEKIETELQKEKITWLKLTGETKVSERIDLVERFNQNNEVKVFLISLKAGGTGLNLTGADMVIHYDPWWNLSAENQATDRAHRIGQKKHVQVYKLITKNSIEEKIYELQEKKAKLADHVLDTKISFIHQLSEAEILALFS